LTGKLTLGRRDVSDRLEQAPVIKPRDPLQGRELDVLEAAPRPPTPDDLRLEQTNYRLGQRVVVRVADAADGGLDPHFGQALGVADRQVLHPAVAVMHEAIGAGALPIVDRLLERIEGQIAA